MTPAADLEPAPVPRPRSPVRARSLRRGRVSRGYASGKADYLARLRKIEGQVRGLHRMVESDAYCPDIVIQVASATRALQEVAVGLLNDHLHHCVVTAMSNSEVEGNESLAELARTIRQVIQL
jgi:CsoR family transcriptional regulator, copper-sensing transcriptional repressor